jgi:hypothetical protein
VLAMLFVGQLVLGGVLRAGLHNGDAASAELVWFAGLYVVLALWQFARALSLPRVLRRQPHLRQLRVRRGPGTGSAGHPLQARPVEDSLRRQVRASAPDGPWRSVWGG